MTLTEKELATLQRRAKGETQKSIASSLGISQAAVSKFETNAHKKILEAEAMLKKVKEHGIVIEEGLAGKKVRYGGGQQ